MEGAEEGYDAGEDDDVGQVADDAIAPCRCRRDATGSGGDASKGRVPSSCQQASHV